MKIKTQAAASKTALPMFLQAAAAEADGKRRAGA
jgi:hypothetical protein